MTSARPRVDAASFPSLGPGQLRPGRESDAVDDMLPQAVITAREIAHVVDAVTEARAKKLGILASGGATMLHVGAPPRCYDIKLSTTALGRVVEQNPEDMTVTVEAGVSLARLQRNLAKAGQRLAVDPPLDERATIGGIVAAGATGGLRYGFGLPRDLLLGLTAIDGRARTIRAGGRVVKNVAGYDLVRLFAGSQGSLGLVTELTLRTHPIPEAAATFVFEFVAPAELDAARGRLFTAVLPLAALDFAVDASGGKPVWMLVVRAEGTEDEVACQGDRICKAVGREPADVAQDWLSPAHVDAEEGLTVRIGAAPSKLVAAVRDVVGKVGGAGLLVGGHLGAGIARFHAADAKFGHTLVTACDAALGAAGDGRTSRVIERAPRSLKTTHETWGAAPASLPLMQELKRRFDPDAVFAPGRLAGGL